MKIVTYTMVSAVLLASSFAVAAEAKNPQQACWGQATKVFAQTGVMGEHSSEQPTPRMGLRNLARLLYEAGIIDDDTMEALGQFVADELGLSIDACMY
ncbi:hypothetical protein [Pseudoalteromonas sp. T1lg75]|uniref:hypothetical protein n=1 Tax=Pseudoalteromonas sp. T1lg75 TaxID=2077102 RepID=UPI000CF70B6C|nr:hypothetical protein [Pseudoalteromonas sp. T1lg75]